MPGLAAVTGATGFIGRSLVRELINKNWNIRALTRRDQPDLAKLQWVRGDLQDYQALETLVDKVDIVIHCAGQVRGNSAEQFSQANVAGTENLVRAVLSQANKPRILLISSLAAREPRLSWYANSKYRGEEVLKDLGQTLDWTIFRPTAVYGPGDREMTPLFRATRLGLLPVTGAPDSRFGLIYVDDLLQAIIRWANATNTRHRIYELDDGTSGGYDRQLVRSIASEVWGHPVYIVSIPARLVRWLAVINLSLSRIFCYLPMLTPGKVRELTHPDWVCDISRLTEDTGWQPVVRLREGLSRAVNIKSRHNK